MTDDQMDDLKQFLEATINNKVRPLEEGFESLENKMDQLSEEVKQRFEEVNQKFEEAAEIQNQILEAVGERFNDHEQRIVALEKRRPAGGALKLKPIA